MVNDDPGELRLASIALEGRFVRLIPLASEHALPLWTAARDHRAELFRWMPYRMESVDDLQAFVDNALSEQRERQSLPFATLAGRPPRLIGSTRFMNIDFRHRRAEIGSAWIVPEWQRTEVNTEAKYLMLRHAFERWQLLRVELKTDALNQKSQDAILRLGAKPEGTLRKHMVTFSGRVRDSVYFSILDSEWPQVRDLLTAKLRRPPQREQNLL